MLKKVCMNFNGIMQTENILFPHMEKKVAERHSPAPPHLFRHNVILETKITLRSEKCTVAYSCLKTDTHKCMCN